MSIKAAFMVPHPPLIVHEVGNGREEEISKTKKAYEEVAEEISKINPETIIISSPHAPYFSDYFYLSSGKNMSGSFKSFGAEKVSFTEEIDEELVECIESIAKENDFPAGRIKKDIELDHGVMVPLYFIRKKYPQSKIIVVGLSSLSLIDNYKMGMIINKAINKLKRNAVYVASGDLSHKLQSYGPYGFIEEGPIYDKKIIDTCSNARFNELLEYDENFLEKAAECGHRSFTIMAGVFDGIDVETKFLSHEDITGVGYGICMFYPGKENMSRCFYDEYLKSKEVKDSTDKYVFLAQTTINNYIVNHKIISVPNNLPNEMLNNKAGVFVSIHKFGNLRGCIGTFLPTTDSIAEEIINNAISAATKDPRFNPITEDELKYLEINVDVLSTPESIDSKEKLNPKKYGVIVTSGYKRGLLLPDLEGIDDIDTQIKITKNKAGINDDEEISLQRFEVIRHK